MSIYLDNAATTRVCPEAAAAAAAAMTEQYGNPSSTHRMGREAGKLLDASRAAVAGALGCAPEELYFTSGGSESDNWAILSGAAYNARHGKHVISSAVEHAAVLRSLDELEKRGFEVTRLKPERDGGVSPAAVLDALREDTGFVTLMTVNNETGAVTDVAGIAKAVKARNPGTLVHTDAVQAFLKVPFQAKTLGADLISLSGHKIHAPKGVGALYIRSGLSLASLILGGGQERGKRAGTEALPLIAAFAAASEAYRKDSGAAERMDALRAQAAERLTAEIPGLLILGGGAPHILSLSLPGYRSEVLMNFLEAKDIYVSRSSACKKGGRSHVLEALGCPSDVIDGAIRVSLSRFTTAEEVDAFCIALRDAAASLRTSVRRR